MVPNAPTVRQHIAKAVRTADLTTVSSKQIRKSVEAQLGLEQDELTSGEWKAFVKTVIEETMAAIERGEEEDGVEDEEARIATVLGQGLIDSKESSTEEECDCRYPDVFACGTKGLVSRQGRDISPFADTCQSQITGRGR
jgi:hypothetical protein